MGVETALVVTDAIRSIATQYCPHGHFSLRGYTPGLLCLSVHSPLEYSA